MSEAAKESRLRSILKAITWRLIATLTTFTLALLVFQDHPDALEKSTLVAGLELFLKLLFYYWHERAWQNAPRGSIRNVFKKKEKK